MQRPGLLLLTIPVVIFFGVTLVEFFGVGARFDLLRWDHSHDRAALLATALIAARTRKGQVLLLEVGTIFFLAQDVTQRPLMLLVILQTSLNVIDVGNGAVLFSLVGLLQVLKLFEVAVVCECN